MTIPRSAGRRASFLPRVAPPPRVALPRIGRLLAAGAVCALAVASVSSAVASTSVSLKPVADTWVNPGSPATNYGTLATIRVDGQPVWNSYLRFDLSGVSGTICGAVLKLHANSAGQSGIAVHPVTSTTWSETSTTAANAPAMGAAAVKSAPFAAGATASIDVTSFITGHGLVSLGLTDNDGTQISLASRESAYPPVLVVTTGATATPTPTAQPTPKPTPTPVGSPVPPATPPPAGPVRAAFYYPWFPEAWDQSGMNPYTHYRPSAGYYDGGSSSVVAGQIQAMQYGKITVGIASWWGQGSGTDKKVPLLLSTAAGTGFRWSIYYEAEGSTNPSATQVASDLAYINSRYGSDPSFYKINGKPVVFVYAQPADGCGMVSRWAQANAAHLDYIVLKVFPGFAGCAGQPDQWHQYSPAVAEDRQAGHSFAISPGFWLATGSVRLARDVTRWQKEVADMVASREPLQLVTTFNEWGEGTAVESATQWSSSSGYGAYLDALHNS